MSVVVTMDTIAMPVAAVEGEARILDLDLGQRLGFGRPRDIRKIIERHRPALEELGVCATVAQPPGGSGGRPTEAFYLNKPQAVYVTAKSETERATEITIEVIQRFDEYERGAVPPPAIARAPATNSRVVFKDFLGIAKMCGFTGNQAALAANRATANLTGVDPLQVMGVTHLLADEQEELLTASVIGERTGGRSAQAVNLQLSRLGLHEKQPAGSKGHAWVPTTTGQRYGRWLDTNKKHGDGTPVRQWKWLASVLPIVTADNQKDMGA